MKNKSIQMKLYQIPNFLLKDFTVEVKKQKAQSDVKTDNDRAVESSTPSDDKKFKKGTIQSI